MDGAGYPDDDFAAPPATPQKLASHLPSWAAEIMLNEETNEAYESEMGRRRSSRIRKQSVDGRVWEELDEDGAFADGEYEDGGGSGAAGMANFTPEELADDYGLPFETVCEFMLLQLGIDKARLRDELARPEPPFVTKRIDELVPDDARETLRTKAREP